MQQIFCKNIHLLFVSELRGEFNQFCQFEHSPKFIASCAFVMVVFCGVQFLFTYMAIIFFYLQDNVSAIFPTEKTTHNVYTSCFRMSLQTIIALTSCIYCALYFPEGSKIYFYVTVTIWKKLNNLKNK